MAVKGPKLPRQSTPVIQTGENPAEKASDSQKTKIKRPQPTSDEFDRIAESLAGSDIEFDQQKKNRRRAAKRQTSTVRSRANLQRHQQTEKLQHKAEQLFHLMALQGFTQESIERHKRELAKIRKELERMQKNQLSETRATASENFYDVKHTDIEQLERELTRIEAIESPLDKAYEAAALILCEDFANDRRRIAVEAVDHDAAIDFATTTNPSTVLLDLVGQNASDGKNDSSRDDEQIQPGLSLDRSLEIVQRLQQLMFFEGHSE